MENGKVEKVVLNISLRDYCQKHDEKVVLDMSLRDFCQKYDKVLEERRKITGEPVRSFAELMGLENAKLYIRI